MCDGGHPCSPRPSARQVSRAERDSKFALTEPGAQVGGDGKAEVVDVAAEDEVGRCPADHLAAPLYPWFVPRATQPDGPNKKALGFQDLVVLVAERRGFDLASVSDS